MKSLKTSLFVKNYSNCKEKLTIITKVPKATEQDNKNLNTINVRSTGDVTTLSIRKPDYYLGLCMDFLSQKNADLNNNNYETIVMEVVEHFKIFFCTK